MFNQILTQRPIRIRFNNKLEIYYPHKIEYLFKKVLKNYIN
jgi:hypothetical protein